MNDGLYQVSDEEGFNDSSPILVVITEIISSSEYRYKDSANDKFKYCRPVPPELRKWGE